MPFLSNLAGFKLFTRDTASVVFESLHLKRWAFDVEMIYISQMLGIPMAVRVCLSLAEGYTSKPGMDGRCPLLEI